METTRPVCKLCCARQQTQFQIRSKKKCPRCSEGIFLREANYRPRILQATPKLKPFGVSPLLCPGPPENEGRN